MNKPIRILQVFGRMDRGGAETFIMNVYRNIDRRKIQFDFIVHTDRDCDYDEEIIKMGGRIYRMPEYKVYNHNHYVREWYNFFENNYDYKIIHAHMTSTASIYLNIANEFNLITISHSHGSKTGFGFKQAIKKYLRSSIKNIADYKFACSTEAGEWLYGKKNDFNVINNGIEYNKFKFNPSIREAKRNELDLKSNKIIGHIANYTKPKNHRFILEFFKELYMRDNTYKIIFIGYGVKENLIGEVRKMGIEEGVLFLGSRSDVNELLQAIDIFILPSLHEGLGIALIEAQAAGLQCYASNRIPQEAKISDNLKFLSIEGKDAIHRWVNEILDVRDYTRRDMYKEIVKYGYDISITANKLEKFYCKLNNIERNI